VWIVLALAFLTAAPGADPPRLQYAVIVTRHGVRAPTWERDRLKQYSSDAWPDFGVPPGHLTARGRALMTLMGGYYGEWLRSERVFDGGGCASAERVFIWADTDQRTLETGRALSESLLPGCKVAVHSLDGEQNDPLFNPLSTPLPAPDLQPAAKAHQPVFRTLNMILTGDATASRVDTLNTASTMSENLLLEYANGFTGSDLGWGRLNASNLFDVMKLHTVYADLTRRAAEPARARGGNLLSHVVASMAQAATGAASPQALGRAGDRLLVIAGHDTNLSNLSGLLGLSWQLPGYQPDDTPPGGALVLSLWRESNARLFVRAQYLAQTLDQMRAQTTLTLKRPPASQMVAIRGCEGAATDGSCPWPSFERVVKRALTP
jgi:4-phytase/acid phosphatase